MSTHRLTLYRGSVACKSSPRRGQGSESGLTLGGYEHESGIRWVPSGGFLAQFYGFLVLCGSDEVDGEVSDDSHVFCSVTLS